MRPLRVIIYGLGTVGRMTARFLKEKQVEVVAAYVRQIEGKDFSAPELEGVEICQPDVAFEKFGADVALMTHCSRLDDLYEPAARAARAGLDVVTIAEDAFEPFYLDDNITKARALDALFRSHDKSLVSVGVQDTFWFSQPLAFLASVQRLERFVCCNICDLGQFGRAGHHGFQNGQSEAEFYAAGYDKASHRRGVFEVALRPLVRALGFTIQSISLGNEPILADKDFALPKSGLNFPKNKVCGMMEKVVFTLEGGVIAEGQFIMRFLPEGESIYNEWVVEGLPNMNMRTDNFQGDAITCASLVNRIPDAIAARPGFLSVDQLPSARHHRNVFYS